MPADTPDNRQPGLYAQLDDLNSSGLLDNASADTAAAHSHRRLRIAEATDADRTYIYRLRHDVYARELHQHAENSAMKLMDRLDESNHYLCVWDGATLVGFISITTPAAGHYSLDKYLPRSQWPFPADENLYEVRLLTVITAVRGSNVAAILMYAALRWVEARGGTRIIAIGRCDVMSLYRKAGLQETGMLLQSGAVTFELIHAGVKALRDHLTRYDMIVRRLEDRLDWQLEIPFRPPAAAFHGGAFFAAIGERFDHLDRCREIISADVLDAWFPPSLKAVKSLREYLPWLIATSPPTHAAGMVETIAERRGVRPENIFVGAGSSCLIYLAFRQWLDRNSKVLILDPTYGEYPHILRNVIGCHVDPFILQRETNYRVDLQRLGDALKRGHNLVVLVNPNSPTGQHIQRELLESVLAKAHENTRIWVDETYVDYVGPEQSLERFAVRRPNVIVCKSMSKVYALSGVRAAYLCAPAHQLEQLRGVAPPWAVSLPAQVAAVNALNDPEYYLTRYGETHKLREALSRELSSMGWDVLPGCANFLLAHLPAEGPTATEWVDACRERGLYLRNAASMSARFGDRALRVAVKDAATNRRMLKILRSMLPS